VITHHAKYSRIFDRGKFWYCLNAHITVLMRSFSLNSFYVTANINVSSIVEIECNQRQLASMNECRKNRKHEQREPNAILHKPCYTNAYYSMAEKILLNTGFGYANRHHRGEIGRPWVYMQLYCDNHARTRRSVVGGGCSSISDALRHPP
jgi:hypothetical protein